MRTSGCMSGMYQVKYTAIFRAILNPTTHLSFLCLESEPNAPISAILVNKTH